MPDRMRKQSSRWKLYDLNEEKGKQQILQKSLLFQTVDKAPSCEGAFLVS